MQWYIHMHTYVYSCTQTRDLHYICIHTEVQIMQVWACIPSIHVCKCVYIYREDTHTHTHIYEHTHEYTYLYSYMRTCTYTHTRIHAHARTNTYTFTDAHKHIHTHTCIYIHRHVDSEEDPIASDSDDGVLWVNSSKQVLHCAHGPPSNIIFQQTGSKSRTWTSQ